MKQKYLRMKKRRGQLQIAETLVSVSLMLILALLLINAADRVNNSYTNTENLEKVGADILSTADEADLLRPAIFLHNQLPYSSEYSYNLGLLNDYIESCVTANIGFALRIRSVVDQVVSSEYVYLIGSQASIASLQQGGEGIVVNYFLGSFSSAVYGNFADQYLLDLYLWEKV